MLSFAENILGLNPLMQADLTANNLEIAPFFADTAAAADAATAHLPDNRGSVRRQCGPDRRVVLFFAVPANGVCLTPS